MNPKILFSKKGILVMIIFLNFFQPPLHYVHIQTFYIRHLKKLHHKNECFICHYLI